VEGNGLDSRAENPSRLRAPESQAGAQGTGATLVSGEKRNRRILDPARNR